jgi:hypothetical protein
MKKLVLHTLLGILTTGALGAVSVFAQTATQPTVQVPVIKGSILLNNDPMAQYLTLAKVSMADAVAAAQKAAGTTEGATSASLEDANGYLVWSVIVAGQEVTVDAGTAEVLYQGAVNADEMDGGDEQGGDEQGGDEQGGNGEMNQGNEQGSPDTSDQTNGDMNGEQGNGDETGGDNDNDGN